METKSGLVTDVGFTAISPPGKRPFKVYHVVLDNGDKVETGFKPSYKVGDKFNSEVEFAYGKYKETKALGTASVSGGTAGSASAPATPLAFPIAKTNKETAIIRQNALTNATNLHAAMIKVGAYVVGEKLPDDVLALAYKFAEFSSGQLEVRRSKELVGDDRD